MEMATFSTRQVWVRACACACACACGHSHLDLFWYVH